MVDMNIQRYVTEILYLLENTLHTLKTLRSTAQVSGGTYRKKQALTTEQIVTRGGAGDEGKGSSYFNILIISE